MANVEPTAPRDLPPGDLPARDLIVLTWDGKGDGPPCYQADADADFDILLFDFTGSRPTGSHGALALLSERCECKGDVYRCVYEHLTIAGADYRYISLFDDDVEVSTSQINAVLEAGPRLGLDLFAPALSTDSYYSFEHTRVRAGGTWHAVEFLEVMMPFYPIDLFMAAGEYYRETVSAYGLDRFIFMPFQKALGYDRVGIVDEVVVRHTKPVSSDVRVYRNGLTAWEERVRIRQLGRDLVAHRWPQWIGTRWYMNCFADPGGPARFWGPWLVWPYLAIRGWAARLSARSRPA